MLDYIMLRTSTKSHFRSQIIFHETFTFLCAPHDPSGIRCNIFTNPMYSISFFSRKIRYLCLEVTWDSAPPSKSMLTCSKSQCQRTPNLGSIRWYSSLEDQTCLSPLELNWCQLLKLLILLFTPSWINNGPHDVFIPSLYSKSVRRRS